MSYERLEQNLTDLILEQQAKLGYRSETLRLYYPLRSLQHLLDCTDDEAGMQERLEQFAQAVSERFGHMKITHRGASFCFVLPPEAGAYVHTHSRPDDFICQLVKLVGAHASMDQVRRLFADWPRASEITPMDGTDFDLLVRFTEGDDPYYYCFKQEGAHVIYHRFLPEDYQELGF